MKGLKKDICIEGNARPKIMLVPINRGTLAHPQITLKQSKSIQIHFVLLSSNHPI